VTQNTSNVAATLANPVYYPETVTLLSVSAPGPMSCIGYPQVRTGEHSELGRGDGFLNRQMHLA
jgi:hypothetical protein